MFDDPSIVVSDLDVADLVFTATAPTPDPATDVADEGLPLPTLIAIIAGGGVFLTGVAFCWRRRVLHIRRLKAGGGSEAPTSATGVVVSVEIKD